MGRYYFDKRDTTDDYKKMAISFFKKHGYLKSGMSSAGGTLYWTRNENPNGNIGFAVTKDDEARSGNIRVYFTQTKNDGEKKELDYKIPIIATPCNYGGLRWWFLDPCGQSPIKCSILYLQNNGCFASRKTLNLCYDEQRESKKYRNLSFMMGMNATRAIVLHRTIKYPYRDGKPTKKMVRFLKLSANNPSLEEIENFEIFSRIGKK